ncbi:MAG: hypothetical protein WB816_18435 [Methylocystis sp.]
MRIPCPHFTDPTNYANSEEFKVNDTQPNISPAMKAAPGFFTFLNSPEEFTASIPKLFLQVVQQARRRD